MVASPLGEAIAKAAKKAGSGGGGSSSKKRKQVKSNEKGLVALLAKAKKKAKEDSDESDSSEVSVMVKAIEGVSGDEVTLTSSLHSDDVFGVNTDSVKALSTDPERMRLRGSISAGQGLRGHAFNGRRSRNEQRYLANDYASICDGSDRRVLRFGQ